MLRVKMEFMLPAKKKSPIAEFDLNLRRSCEKGQKGIVIVFKRRGQKTILKTMLHDRYDRGNATLN